MRNYFLTAATALLAAAFATAAPIETAGVGLTQETWSDVKTGTWLVEHFSPYCSHCRAFAPKWREIVDLRETDALAKGFHFAQVDCAANGDLCHTNGVKYYPSIFLYVNGEVYDEYSGKRSVEDLSKYVDENMPGTVVWLDKDGKPERATEEEKTALAESKAKDDSALHVETESDDSSASPYDALLDDAVKPSTVVETSTVPDALDEIPVVPAFVTQIREQKREELPRPDGQVHVLKNTELAGLKDSEGPAAFVKYYAPWCGHCKTLAPRWADMATSLANQVHVYEMDCDAAENKKVCAGEKVRAFPTLIFYNKGGSVVYNGKRDVETMKSFALKAVSATTVKPLANEYELKRAAQDDDVIILFVHTGDTSKDDLALVTSASKTLLGGAPFYTSTSPDLFSLFSLGSTPALLVFKDHSLSPADVFHLPPSTLPSQTRLEATKQWLRSAKLPTLVEMSGATYNDLMPTTGNPPLVGVAVLSRKAMGHKKFEDAKKGFEDVAKGWLERRKVREVKGRDVVWSWVDGDKWAGWAKSMYGIKAGGGEEGAVAISDPKSLSYWKKSIAGAPLTLHASDIYALIEEGIYTGSAPALSSRSFVERMGDSVVKTSSSLRKAATSHPIITVLLVVASWFGLWYLYRWASVPLGPSSGYEKYE